MYPPRSVAVPRRTRLRDQTETVQLSVPTFEGVPGDATVVLPARQIRGWGNLVASLAGW